jgi:hypothetical protein
MSISQKRLEEILNIPDDAIATSDIPELGDRFQENAKMVTCVLMFIIIKTEIQFFPLTFLLFPWRNATHSPLFIADIGISGEIVAELIANTD